MPSRSSRYDPRYDDPYAAHDPYPDAHTAANDDAYEYVGPESFPEPPAHTFEPGDSSPPRRHSPPPYRRSRRASTQPPRSDAASPPPKLRRAASPPARSSRHSHSPPRRSRRDASPPVQAAKATSGPQESRRAKLAKRPAVQNMKTYGRKGLGTLGDVAAAYVAAQNAPMERGRPSGRDYPYDGYYPDADPYERPHRSRRVYSLSPSPSPPRRRRTHHSDRTRPPLNGRQKSYSVSPTPSSRDPDYGYGRGRGSGRRSDKRSSRYSVSPSPSVSPPRRRGQSHSHRDRTPSTKPSRRRSSMTAAKDSLRSPNPEIAHRWQLAARAALEAGGVTAFRLRKEPGSWTGQKGAKVATAALGAAAIDAFIDKDPRRAKGGGMKGMAESVIGGMIASKVMGFKSATTSKGVYRY